MTPLEYGLITAIVFLICVVWHLRFLNNIYEYEIRGIHKSLKSKKYIKLPPRGQNGRFLKRIKS